MAPRPEVVDVGGGVDGVKKMPNALQLNLLKKAIPEEAFVKSALKSSFYMFFDYTWWSLSLVAIYTLRTSSHWTTMPSWQQWAATLVFWNVAGFFMW